MTPADHAGAQGPATGKREHLKVNWQAAEQPELQRSDGALEEREVSACSLLHPVAFPTGVGRVLPVSAIHLLFQASGLQRSPAEHGARHSRLQRLQRSPAEVGITLPR